MLLSTNKELRLHIPSNAVDDVSLLQGILDNSEKDFLKDKIGASLYDQLCTYYSTLDKDAFYDSVVDGTHASDPWAELLLKAQRMITNDAVSRYIYQQVISVNGAGVNVVSNNDYGAADDRLLDKGVTGYKREAMVSLNNLLILLEEWARQVAVVDDDAQASNIEKITTIITLWKKSKYYYDHSDLLIPTCSVLQPYLDIYENRDKFIRLLPDIRFIQEEYIEDAFGSDFVTEMLEVASSEDSAQSSTSATAPTAEDIKLLKKTRRLMVAYLEERTTILTIDKQRRQQAHNEAISLKESLLSLIKAKEASNESTVDSGSADATTEESTGYKNNQQGSKIFVAPLLY